MLNGYEIAMLLTIAASFVFMMWRLFRAFEQEKRERQEKREQQADRQKHGND